MSCSQPSPDILLCHVPRPSNVGFSGDLVPRCILQRWTLTLTQLLRDYNAEGSMTENTGDGQRLRQHLKRKKQDWRGGGNAIEHIVVYSSHNLVTRRILALVPSQALPVARTQAVDTKCFMDSKVFFFFAMKKN